VEHGSKQDEGGKTSEANETDLGVKNLSQREGDPTADLPMKKRV
jgi:hypothetical protein